jgi:polyisoprenoid-binding protein YceI
MRSVPAAGGLALAAWAALAAGPPWRLERGEVRVVCPLTVGGSFEARTGALAGAFALGDDAPGRLEGEASVDLGTLETGIGLRDDHLRNEYLEVGRGEGFARAVLAQVRLAEAKDAAFEGRTAFSGVLRVHGTSREVRGGAEIRRTAGGVRVHAGFSVALADFGVRTPRYLGVGVEDVVQVRVSFLASRVTERDR